MSRNALDEELNTAEQSLSVDEILAEFRAQEASAPVAAAAPSPRAVDWEPEEDVRIYRPGRQRQAEPAPPARESAEKAAPREKRSRTSAGDTLSRLRGFFSRPLEKAAPSPEKKPEPELPSFEDLLLREQDEPALSPESSAEGFSIDQILADYLEDLGPAVAPPPPARQEPPASPRRTAPPAPAAKRPPAAPARAQRSSRAAAPERERPQEKYKNEDVEYHAMSVDNILAEYKEIMAAMPPEDPASPQPAPDAPRGQVSRMEQEARSFIAQMKSEDFSGIREEAAYDKPLPETPSAPQSEPAPAHLNRPEPEQTAPPAEAEIDPRFRMDRERRSAMVFGGKELDLSAEEGYVPPKAAQDAGFHWVAGEEELPEKPIQKHSLLRRKKKAAPVKKQEKEHTEGYEEAAGDAYAPAGNYDREETEEPEESFPSFGQYLSGLFTGLLVRLLGVRRGTDSAETMEDDVEDLGPELKPASASKYYGSFILSLRLRLRIGLVLLAVMAWIALGLPVSGALRSVQVASGMALAIQLVILLLSLDVVTGAAINLARGRFGADSLAVLGCVFTSFDALAVTLGAFGTPHMPLCLVSSASLLGILLSSLASARGLRKALRVPAIGKRCYTVTGDSEVTGKGLTLLKSMRPPKGFVRRSEEAAPDETLFTRLAPLLLVLALLLALIVGLIKHAMGDFLFLFTALLCPAVPLTALLAFALPYLFGSLRIFHSGAAIAGWSGLSDIGRSANLIVTDRDLFPEGSVEIDTVRIFADVQPETIISYAGTMICASGSDLAPCFAELMEKNGCPMRRVEAFEYLSGGGMKGVIDGSVVLCGGVELMRLMNVRVPYRLVSKTTVLLSVDGILCGIFNMKYQGQPQVRKALVGLIRSNRHPIFAIRDFLVTPEMLAGCFDVATDGYDFPPYVDRFSISEAKPAETSKIAAVVCREGLGPLVHMADTGRSMYLATRFNLAVTALAAVLGVLAVFIRLLSVGTVGSGFLLLYLLLWALPVTVVSLFLRF